MRNLVAAVAAFALLAPAAHATSWAEIPSGTTAEISAIEYQGEGRFWYTTTTGAIFKRQPDGSFAQVRAPGGVRLNDIEFQDGGQVGLAVGDAGLVLRSTDAGATWNAISGIPVSRKAASATFPDCTATEPLGTVNSVRFAGDSRVWIFAEGSQLARSSGTAATVGANGTWVDANRDTKGTASPTDDTCRISGSLYNEGLSDGFFSPTSPDVGYIVHGSFADVFFTADNLASNAAQKPAGAGNTGGPARTLAGDPSNPSRMWSVNPTPYGRSTTGFTEDGFATANPWVIANDTVRAFTPNGPYDVAYRNGTVLSAGNEGMILMSVNGRDFYYVDAGGAVATQDWRSVALADASHAAVGGTGGKLIVSQDANLVPDTTKPTGTISGPDTGTVGQPLTYTATLADEAGGSGINPAASSWTTPGLPNQSGPSATFTFPQAGTYTITLAFADNAGNTNAAAKSVTVGAAALPVPTLPSSSHPPITGGGARKKGKYIVLRVKGRLGLPPGADKAAACQGRMSISVYKGKKRLVGKKTKVTKSCGYKKRIKVKRRKVGKAKKLKLKVAFKGNAVLAPLSSTYKVKVKKR